MEVLGPQWKEALLRVVTLYKLAHSLERGKKELEGKDFPLKPGLEIGLHSIDQQGVRRSH